MRIRTVKPEFWGHPVMAQLPAETQLMALALISWSDDFGYFEADVRAIRGGVMPYRDDLASIERDVTRLVEVGFVEVRDADGRKVGRVVKFDLHQKVERPKPSKLKAYFDAGSVTDSSVTNHRSITEASVTNHRRKGREGKGRDQEGRAQADRLRDGSPPAQVPLPAEVVPPAPSPAPRPPSRIGRLHAKFLELREQKLICPPEAGGLDMLDVPPDEPPDWGRSAAALAQWVALWPGLSEAEVDANIARLMFDWLEQPYWAGTVDKHGKPRPPYPWGAFITEGQWRPLVAPLFGELPAAGGVH